MLDIRAFTAIVHETLQSRSHMHRFGETTSEDYATLVRVLAHLSGAEYNTPGWSPRCTEIRTIIDRAMPRAHDWTSLKATVAPLTAGALMTVVPSILLPTTYRRDETGYQILRANGTEVRPSDHDYLTACGYVQVDQIGDVIRQVAG